MRKETQGGQLAVVMLREETEAPAGKPAGAVVVKSVREQQ